MALPVCTIDENGIFKPDFATVKTFVEEKFRSIYGQDVYIEPDSQDGQFLSIFTSAIDDANNMAVQAYNAFSPSTARGVGLSSVVKINGIARQVASFSTVDLVVVGQAGTIITDGIALDEAGEQWLLPDSVTIPPGGEITVTAIAKNPGALQAIPGSVSVIGSPTRGWQSVTNVSAAAPGSPVETDAELRRRQTISTMIPSLTILEGIVGAVANLPGVVRYRAYENDTSITDANGQPSHSIALMVEGGDAQDIAESIAAKKSPGTHAYGTTVQTVVDIYDIPHLIGFFRPTPVTIKVHISLTALPGYSTIVEGDIKQQVVDFLTGLQIGEDVEWAEVFVPANLALASGAKTYKITALTIARGANPPGVVDIDLLYNEAAEAALSDVTITVS